MSHIPSPTALSSSADEVLDVFRRDELEGNVDLLVHLFALGELQSRIERALALPGCVLEHRHVEVTGLHGGKRILRGVNAADHDLAS